MAVNQSCTRQLDTEHNPLNSKTPDLQMLLDYAVNYESTNYNQAGTVNIKREPEDILLQEADFPRFNKYAETNNPSVEIIHTVAGSKYCCLLCYDEFLSFSEFDQHFKSHKNYKCKTNEVIEDSKSCTISFVTTANVVCKEEDLSNTLCCAFCTFSTFNQQDLNTHVLTHNDCSTQPADPESEKTEFTNYDNENLYQCLNCDFSTNFQDELNKHVKVHEIVQHLEQQPVFKCIVCSEMFNSAGKLRAHNKYHEENIVYQCLSCENFFTKHKTSIKRHIEGHTRKRLSNLITKADVNKLIMHLKKASLNDTAVSDKFTRNSVRGVYVCCKCNYSNRNRNKMFAHYNSLHLEIILKCSKCPFTTDEKSVLNSHMMVHLERVRRKRVLPLQISDSEDGRDASDSIATEIESVTIFSQNATDCQNTNVENDVTKPSSELGNFEYFTVIKDNTIHPIGNTEIEKTTNVNEDPLSLNNFDGNRSPSLTDDPTYACNTSESSDSEPVTKPTANKKQEVECYVCKRMFSSHHHLTSHLPTHFRNNSKRCNICNKNFKTKSASISHSKTHNGELERIKTLLAVASIYEKSKTPHIEEVLNIRDNIECKKKPESIVIDSSDDEATKRIKPFPLQTKNFNKPKNTKVKDLLEQYRLSLNSTPVTANSKNRTVVNSDSNTLKNKNVKLSKQKQSNASNNTETILCDRNDNSLKTPSPSLPISNNTCYKSYNISLHEILKSSRESFARMKGVGPEKQKPLLQKNSSSVLRELLKDTASLVQNKNKVESIVIDSSDDEIIDKTRPPQQVQNGSSNVKTIRLLLDEATAQKILPELISNSKSIPQTNKPTNNSDIPTIDITDDNDAVDTTNIISQNILQNTTVVKLNSNNHDPRPLSINLKELFEGYLGEKVTFINRTNIKKINTANRNRIKESHTAAGISDINTITIDDEYNSQVTASEQNGSSINSLESSISTLLESNNTINSFTSIKTVTTIPEENLQTEKTSEEVEINLTHETNHDEVYGIAETSYKGKISAIENLPTGYETNQKVALTTNPEENLQTEKISEGIETNQTSQTQETNQIDETSDKRKTANLENLATKHKTNQKVAPTCTKPITTNPDENLQTEGIETNQTTKTQETNQIAETSCKNKTDNLENSPTKTETNQKFAPTCTKPITTNPDENLQTEKTSEGIETKQTPKTQETNPDEELQISKTSTTETNTLESLPTKIETNKIVAPTCATSKEHEFDCEETLQIEKNPNESNMKPPEENEKTFVCAICEIIFPFSTFEIHMKNHFDDFLKKTKRNSELQKLVEDKLCKKVFDNNAELHNSNGQWNYESNCNIYEQSQSLDKEEKKLENFVNLLTIDREKHQVNIEPKEPLLTVDNQDTNVSTMTNDILHLSSKTVVTSLEDAQDKAQTDNIATKIIDGAFNHSPTSDMTANFNKESNPHNETISTIKNTDVVLPNVDKDTSDVIQIDNTTEEKQYSNGLSASETTNFEKESVPEISTISNSKNIDAKYSLSNGITQIDKASIKTEIIKEDQAINQSLTTNSMANFGKNNHTQIVTNTVSKRDVLVPGMQQYICPECGFNFTNVITLACHRRVTHGQFNCEICNRKYLYIHSLHAHMVCSHPDISFKVCAICHFYTTKEDEYTKHMETHQTNLEKNADSSKTNASSCSKCDYVSTTLKGLLIHDRLVHGRGTERSCHKCKTKFPSISSLKLHMKTHNKFLKCLQCDYKTKLKSKMEIHVQEHRVMKTEEKKNNEQLKSYKCKICKLAVSSKQYLLEHIKNVHHKEKHNCATCNQKFPTISALRLHMKIHFFNCIVCKYFTKDRKKLEEHMDTFHLNSNHTNKKSLSLMVEHPDVESIEELISPTIVYKSMPNSPRVTRSKFKVKLQKSPSRSQSKFEAKSPRITRHYTRERNTEVSTTPPQAKEQQKIELKQTNLYEKKSDDSVCQNVDKMTCHKSKVTNTYKSRIIQNGINSLLNISKKNITINSTKKSKLAKKCKYCKFVLKSDRLLKLHMQLHTGRFTCECYTCKYKPKNKKDREIHSEIHKQFAFLCTLCNFCTRFKYKLKAHVASHTGERPYHCKLCNHCATSKRLLYIHLYAHLIVKKKFKCKFCNYRSKQKNCLRRHAKQCVKIKLD